MLHINLMILHVDINKSHVNIIICCMLTSINLACRERRMTWPTQICSISRCTAFTFYFKAALDVMFIFFSSLKLLYMKKNQYKHVFGNLFLMERFKYCSTFMINIESSLIHSWNIYLCIGTCNPFYLHSKGNLFFKISGVCFKITYLMTNHNIGNCHLCTRWRHWKLSPLHELITLEIVTLRKPLSTEAKSRLTVVFEDQVQVHIK